jgi:integrase/recombinase XerC
MSASPFSGVAQLHRAHNLASGLSSRTLDWYDQQFRHFDAWRVAAGLADLIPTAEVLERYLAEERARGLRPTSLHARYRSLRTLVNFAIKRRLLPREENPFAFMRPPKIPRERPPYVTPEEMRLLLGTCWRADWLDHRDALILCLLFYSGLRLAEVCALEVSDVDMGRMEVFVRRGKGAKARTVPMAQEVRQPLLDYLYSRPSNAAQLLLSSTAQGNARGALTGSGLRIMLRRRCTQAGIEQRSAHKFRHGFAMWLRNNGADLSDIAAAMGHTTTQVTQLFYANTLPPAVHRAYNAAIARLRDGAA